MAGVLAYAASACPDAGLAQTLDFDQNSAASGFRVRAGMVPLRGTFQRLRGQLRLSASEARACVRTELDATSVVMGTDTFGAWARSPDFFDAERHPRLEFRSLPFDPSVLLRGGVIDGTLTLRDTTRRQQLRAEPARCTPPPQGLCKVTLQGAMLRSSFGMLARRPFVSDRVDLDLRFEAPRADLFPTDAAPLR